jgi:hypothetical protein
VTDFYVNLQADRVVFIYNPDQVSIEEIKDTLVEKSGKIGEVKEIES